MYNNFNSSSIKWLSNSQYSLNVQLSNLQLNELMSVIKTETVFRLSSNMIGNFDDETNFPHELF